MPTETDAMENGATWGAAGSRPRGAFDEGTGAAGRAEACAHSPAREAAQADGRALTVRAGRFAAGICMVSLALVLLIRSGLGVSPWAAFHVGLARVAGMSIGTAVLAATGALALVNTLLRSPPRVATLVEGVILGLLIDVFLPLVPAAAGAPGAWAFLLVAVLVCGLGVGLYISAGFGMGVRDGLVVVLSGRAGWSVRRMRTAVEVFVLLAGWAMGATVGVGTIVFSLLIGVTVQWGFALFGVGWVQVGNQT